MRVYSERDIHLALDGELPADDRLGYEKWLATNPDMQTLVERYEGDQGLLKEALDPLLLEPVPERLARLAGSPAGETVYSNWRYLRYAAAGVALFVLGGLASYVAGPQLSPNSSTLAQLADGAMQAHMIYSGEKEHVVEVSADQRDHLQGWLSNGIGIKLVAPDLRNQGYELVGGRLLPAGKGTAAQLMYQDPTGSRVSIYVMRDKTAADSGYKVMEDGNIRTVYWLDSGYACAVTGSAPEKTLQAIAEVTYDQAEHI